ncbi:MAG: hypothetical protein ABI895_32215 [Deltaproteobacteria bacterium]
MASLRSTPLIAAALAVAIPWHAQASEPCAWKDTGKPPRLFLRDRVVFFRSYYASGWAACAARPNDKVRVQWFAGKGSGGTPIRTEELGLDRSTREPSHKLEARLFPNAICDGRAPQPGAQRKLTGVPGEERLSELVPVQVSISAGGSLAPLAQQSAAIDVPCPACGTQYRGSLSARVEQDGTLTLKGELEATWFECVKQGATLALRAFAGRSEADAQLAIRPDLVLADLEKSFVRKGDKYVLHKTLPKARLCAGDAHVWSFEFWGRGELQRASGGGRTIYSMQCK